MNKSTVYLSIISAIVILMFITHACKKKEELIRQQNLTTHSASASNNEIVSSQRDIIEGEILPNSTKNLFKGNLSNDIKLTIENTGNTDLRFCRTNSDNKKCIDGTIVPSGETRSYSLQDLGGSSNDQNINVTNPAMENPGHYKVTITKPQNVSTVVTVSSSSDLKQVIEAATDYTFIKLLPGDYSVKNNIEINHKSYIKIMGSGCNKTKIKLDPAVTIGFVIGNNINDFELSNMSISVDGTLTTNTHAIGSHCGVENVENVNIHNLCISNVAVGISVGGACLSDVPDSITGDIPYPCSSEHDIYMHVVIRDNIIESPRQGTGQQGSGRGYGIHNDNAKDVLIYHNQINKAGRHSIYQGRGENVIIKNNLITNHDWYNAQDDNSVAIAIARSRAILVQDNIILNCYTSAMSAEADDQCGYHTDKLTYVNNKIIGGRVTGLYITSIDPISLLGNKFIPHSGDIAFTDPSYNNNNYTYYLSFNSSCSSFPPPLDVADIEKIGDYYYIMKCNVLYKINDIGIDGAVNILSQSPTNWFNFNAMTGLENVVNGEDRLYIIQNNILHEVNPNDWSYTHSNINWFDTKGMSSAQGYVHVMQNDVLHRVTPGTLSYIYSPVNWFNFGGICSWGGYIYILQNGIYHKVDPISLSYQVIGW